MAGVRSASREVRYYTLPSAAEPWLLARVRWPDVYQAISSERSEWIADPGLFDLPYDRSSVAISFEQAEAIAAGWGAALPADHVDSSGPALIRRMPANWSALTPAEKRAWSIEPQSPPDARRWWQRRRGAKAAAPAVPVVPDAAIVLVDVRPEPVIDLTDGALAETQEEGA